MKTNITCPKCSHNFEYDVDGQLREKADAEAEKRLRQEIEAFKEKLAKEKQAEAEEAKKELTKEKAKARKEAEEKADEKAAKAKEEEITQLKMELARERKKIEKLKPAKGGSQQTQGAVLEEMVEKRLEEACKEADVLDKIIRTKNGADIYQIVMSNTNKECGSILWEVKNAASWQSGWITKLKKDMADKKADLGIIVVQDTLEKVENQWHEGDRIFVTKLDYVKALALTLRKKIMEVAELRNNQKFKDKKLEMAYTYIFDGEFIENLKLIITCIDRDKRALEKEQDAVKKIWAERETRLGFGRDAAIKLLGGISEIKELGGEMSTKLLLVGGQKG